MVPPLAFAIAGALTMTSVVVGQVTPAIPNILPTNWTSVGCFSDVSTSRTLAATSLVQDPMTVELCINFCSSGNFLFAGVEFGRVSLQNHHCDSTIQIPSVPEPATDCNMACSGNSAELCGGPVRLNIFTSNQPPPVIPKNITSTAGSWTYQGCFTDTPTARTLGTGVNIPLGTTAESCTAACLAQGAFTFAGVENGHECWCDTAVHAPTQRVGDADCRELCTANHGEYCGNANRIAVYQFTPAGQSATTRSCLQTTVANFTLRAQYKNPPINGPSSVPIRVVSVEQVANVQWTVLSACPNCCSEWPAFSLTNSIISPHSIVIPTQQMTSTFTNDGESPNFVASIPAFPGSQSYCTMTDTAAVAGSPSILAFNGKPDAFSLCTNNSANARVDLIFSPVTGHPHYTLDTCQPVNVQVITS